MMRKHEGASTIEATVDLDDVRGWVWSTEVAPVADPEVEQILVSLLNEQTESLVSQGFLSPAGGDGGAQLEAHLANLYGYEVVPEGVPDDQEEWIY